MKYHFLLENLDIQNEICNISFMKCGNPVDFDLDCRYVEFFMLQSFSKSFNT